MLSPPDFLRVSEQREFREIYESELGPVEKSERFVAKVDELGLTPYDAPTAKSPIREEDIQLICWMVVTPPEDDDERDWGSLHGQSTLGSIQ